MRTSMLPASSSSSVVPDLQSYAAPAPSASQRMVTVMSFPNTAEADPRPRSPVPAQEHQAMPLVTRDQIDRQYLLVFQLDDQELPFDKRTVPPPPVVSFADNVERIWHEWHSSRLLVINGCGIPVKDWGRINLLPSV